MKAFEGTNIFRGAILFPQRGGSRGLRRICAPADRAHLLAPVNVRLYRWTEEGAIIAQEGEPSPTTTVVIMKGPNEDALRKAVSWLSSTALGSPGSRSVAVDNPVLVSGDIASCASSVNVHLIALPAQRDHIWRDVQALCPAMP